MSQEPTQNRPIDPIYMRMGLLLVLIIIGMVIISSVKWIFLRILSRLGLEIAEVVVAFLMVLIVILILFGFWAGLGADRILHRRKIQAFRIYRALKRSRVMRSLWWYVEPSGQIKNDRLPTVDVEALLERTPRRGRPPTYSLDRWIRVVHAWENRDTLRNTLTLTEFLAEQFGTYADGSPRMSDKSYYEWRKKVFNELQKQATSNKAGTNA